MITPKLSVHMIEEMRSDHLGEAGAFFFVKVLCASVFERLFACKDCVRQCSFLDGTRAGIKKALQRVFSRTRWAG